MTNTGGKSKAKTLSDLADEIGDYSQEVMTTPDIQVKECVLRQFKNACDQVSSADNAKKNLSPDDMYSAYLQSAMNHYIHFLLTNEEKQKEIQAVLESDEAVSEREEKLYHQTMTGFRKEIKERLIREFD